MDANKNHQSAIEVFQLFLSKLRSLHTSQTELVHDDDLEADWKSGKINAQEYASPPGLWSASLSIKVQCVSIDTTIWVANKLVEGNKNFTSVVFAYERLGIAIPAGPVLDEVLSGPSGYKFRINHGWVTGYRVSLDAYFQMQSIGPVVNPASDDIDPNWVMSPMTDGANKDRLVNAVRTRGTCCFSRGRGDREAGRRHDPAYQRRSPFHRPPRVRAHPRWAALC